MYETIKRLEETEILFGQMKNSLKDHRTFRANLNAFVQSARSITWVMQKEFSKNPKFKEWYESLSKEIKDDEIFEFFKKLRNTSVKEKSVGNTFKITTKYEPGLTLKDGDVIPIGQVGKDGNFILADSSKITRKGKSVDIGVKSQTSLQYCFEEKPDVDAIELCSIYLQKLKKIAVDCHNKFSPSKES